MKTLPTQSRRLNGRVLPAFLIAVLLAQGACGIPVQGLTGSGRAFEGNLFASDGGQMKIRPQDPGEIHEWGLPVEALASLSLVPRAGERLLSEENLQLLRPLLHRLSEQSTGLLIERMRACIAREEWELAYHWSVELLQVHTDAPLETCIRLLKAICLREMGLFRRLKEELTRLNAEISPLSAPAELCSLNALMAERQGDWARAYFWARIAFLRIPAHSSGQDTGLRELAQVSAGKLNDPIP